MGDFFEEDKAEQEANDEDEAGVWEPCPLRQPGPATDAEGKGEDEGAHAHVVVAFAFAFVHDEGLSPSSFRGHRGEGAV